MNINKLKEYDDDDDVNEKNILKDYIEENYYNNFENRSLENQESSNFYNILSNKLELNSEECDSRKEELNLICKEYEWMSKNIYKHKFFKNSNANKLFENLKIIFENIKKIMIQNSEIRFKIFIKQFNQVFKIMDKKFKGNLLSKTFEKEIVKKNIISTYKKYSKKILDEIEKKYIQSNKEIDDYITKIDSDENFDPEKEGKKIVNNIKQNLEKIIKIIEKDFNDYQKELKEIGKEIIEVLENDNINDNINVNYDDSIFINLISTSHLKMHLGLLIPSVILSLIPFGIGIGIVISLHSVTAITNLVIDLADKKNTLKKHMIDFKFDFGLYYIEFKKNIETRLSFLKNQLVNDVELIVEFNNKKFDPRNNEKFQSIYNDYRINFY